jgi:hypothetical protein
MESCDKLLAVLRKDAEAQEWAGTCARLKVVFEKMPTDAKDSLVASDACIPALLHAIGGGKSSVGDDWATDALCGSCEALNALIAGLPKGVKQSLLSGEKGVVDALLRVLADAKVKSAWGSVGFCFKNMFLDVAADVRQQLLSDGRGIVEAIVGVLNGDAAAAWEGACGALRALPVDISVSVKQALLSGEKGVVRALMRVLGDPKGKSAWGNACFSLANMIAQTNDDFKESLFTDGRGIVEAIVGVLNGDEAAAWQGACHALNEVLAHLTPSAKSVFLLSQPRLVVTLTSRLENEDAWDCWAVAFKLLKRLVYQEPSLSHINLLTLDFLKNDSGLMAVLLRCSHGFINGTDNESFRSVCNAINSGLAFTASYPPFTGPSLQILTKLLAAAQSCSDDRTLSAFVGLLANFSINVNYCSVLVQAKCHEYVLSKIICVPGADAVWNNSWSVATESLATVVYLSRNVSLHAELIRLNTIDILASLTFPDDCVAGTRKLMALSYLIGSKECDSSSASLALSQLCNSFSISKIIDVLENTLNLKGGPGYGFGSFMLPAILQVRRHSFYEF